MSELMIDAADRKAWVLASIIAGVLYFIVGYGSAVVDPSIPDRARFWWRVTAWLISAVVFAVHIGYERFRLRNAPRLAALHTAAAVALGAFLIAAAALVHATTVIEHAPYLRFVVALAIWPIITAVPAFLVALVASALFSSPASPAKGRI